jgi:hypothetical protein
MRKDIALLTESGKEPHWSDGQIVVDVPFEIGDDNVLIAHQFGPTFDEWRAATDDIGQRIKNANGSLGKLAAYAWINFTDRHEDVMSVIIEAVDNQRVTDNLFRCLNIMPQELMLEAADPASRVSVWMAGTTCVCRPGTHRKEPLFSVPEQVRIIRRWAAQEIDRQDVIALKENRRAEIKAQREEEEARRRAEIAARNGTDEQQKTPDESDTTTVEQAVEFIQFCTWAYAWSPEVRERAVEYLMGLDDLG